MSQATKQQLTLVNTICQGIRAVMQCHVIGDQELNRLLSEALEETERAVIGWPISGDERDHQNFAQESVNKWQEFLEGTPDFKWTITATVGLSIQIWDDLYSRIKDSKKKAILDKVLPRLMAVSDWLDVAGRKVDDYQFSSGVVSELHRIVGFEA